VEISFKRKGLRISKSKTEYIQYEFDERVLKKQVDETSVRTISGNEVSEVESFKYLVGPLCKRMAVLTKM